MAPHAEVDVPVPGRGIFGAPSYLASECVTILLSESSDGPQAREANSQTLIVCRIL